MFIEILADGSVRSCLATNPTEPFSAFTSPSTVTGPIRSGAVFKTTVDPVPVVKGIEIVGVLPPDEERGDKAETDVTDPVVLFVYTNPVPEELTANTCPTVPIVARPVPPDEVSKGFSNVKSVIVGAVFKTTVDPVPVVKGIEIVGVLPPDEERGDKAETDVTDPAVLLVYTNPVPEELTANTWPIVPIVARPVPPDEVGKGFSNVKSVIVAVSATKLLTSNSS